MVDGKGWKKEGRVKVRDRVSGKGQGIRQEDRSRVW